MKATKVFSSGGGVQSTAALVLSSQGKIDFPIHVFANVGNRAESRQTIDYVANVLAPYAKANGIQWVEVRKKDRAGVAIDLLDKIETLQRSVPIPVRMAGSGAPGIRSCTVDWKIEPVAKFLKGLISVDIVKSISNKTRGLAKADKFEAQTQFYLDLYPIVLGKGISIDEAQRAKKDTGFAHYQAAYPLIDLGLTRMDCHKIIADAGLPPAPKSSCWFCPYKTKAAWQNLHDSDPDRFKSAVDLEKLLHARSVALGRGGCYFTSTGTTKSLFLDQVVSPHYQQNLFHGFDDSECESGYCWT